ncbi:carboxypeptidase-like regulatory domain-containing protein [Roseivirga sp. BDSF3-8]|uniref:carboxypeptidase-like regulatory domain-containing protein n=1 Tax=Roseivirga sp. BDSF3-8 TaxID=3241598 RepID=UPI0035321214
MSTGETQLFTTSGELTLRAMQLYSQGALPSPDKEKVQAYLDANPFEAEALEGISQAGDAEFDKGLAALRKDLRTHIPGATSHPIHVKLPYWQAAAAVLIMLTAFAASLFILESRYGSPDSMLAMQTPEKEAPVTQTERAKPVENNRPPASGPETRDVREIIEVPDEEEIDEPTEAPSVTEKVEEELLIAANSIEEELEPVEETASSASFSTHEEPQIAAADLALYADSMMQARKEKHQEAMAMARNKDALDTEEALVAEATDEVPVHLVYGTVLSGNGAPLYDVTISILGTDKSFTTDRQGDFKITVDEPTDILRFSYRGISDLDVPVANREHLVVTLSARGNEVKTVGEDGRELPARSNAAPGGGYSAYKTYLRQKLSNLPDGRIVLEFTVTETGELKDFEVIKGINEVADKELIEAMENGPRWQPAFEQGMAVPSRARYRLRIR